MSGLSLSFRFGCFHFCNNSLFSRDLIDKIKKRETLKLNVCKYEQDICEDRNKLEDYDSAILNEILAIRAREQSSGIPVPKAEKRKLKVCVTMALRYVYMKFLLKLFTLPLRMTKMLRRLLLLPLRLHERSVIIKRKSKTLKYLTLMKHSVLMMKTVMLKYSATTKLLLRPPPPLLLRLHYKKKSTIIQMGGLHSKESVAAIIMLHLMFCLGARMTVDWIQSTNSVWSIFLDLEIIRSALLAEESGVVEGWCCLFIE